MSSRTAIFASTFLAGLLAGAGLAVAASDTPERAADNCLRAPKDETPRGSHWYYRIDHATQRKCWYLGEEKDKDKVARAALQDSAPAADSVSPPKSAPEQRSVADARAEFPPPATRIEPQTRIFGGQPAPTAPANIAGNENSARTATADADRQASVVASRWPGTSDVTPIVNPAPPMVNVAAAAPPNPPVAPPNPPVAPPQAAAPPPQVIPAVTLAAADAPPSGKPWDSIPMLLTVAVGALSVVGVMGSAIFRIGSKRRSRRRKIWGDRPAPREANRAGRVPPPVKLHPRELHGRVDERRGRPRQDDPNQRIDELLAQLSRQGRG
jgi:hypothetical protein